MTNNNFVEPTDYEEKQDLYDPEDCDLIVLDLNNEEKNDKYTYLKRNDYKEYSGNSFVWESSSKNDFTFLTLFYDGDEKYIVIFPYVGNLILLRKSDNGSWINLKTCVNFNKLKMFDRRGHYVVAKFIHYELQMFNLKMLFNCFCELVIYEGNLIYKHCDRPVHGYPYSLSFNLLHNIISIHLMDESILKYQNVKKEVPEIKYSPLKQNDNFYYTSHYTPNNEMIDYKIQKTIKKIQLEGFKYRDICLFDINFHDRSVDIESEHAIIDGNLIMSTDKYVTFSSLGHRGFDARKGFYFSKMINRSLIRGYIDYPPYVRTQVGTRRSYNLLPENRDLEYKPRSNPDYLSCMKPDITKFKFYGNDDVEIKSDDMEVCYDDLFYVIKFKTELHRVVYDGKEYWNYNNNKNNGFPIKIYFTDYNNDMNVCFNDGKIEKVKIKVLYIKMFKIDGFGNRVMITDKEYKVSKIERDKRLYKLNEGVKCTEIWHYDGEFVWKHKEGDPYPISIVYYYYFRSISIRFESYFFVSVRGIGNLTWGSLIFPIPKHVKLYKLDKIGNKLELNYKDYDFDCNYFGSFIYDLKKNVECVELKFHGETLWKHEQSQPYPHSFDYSVFGASITVYCKTLNVNIDRNNGIWDTEIVVNKPYLMSN
uniref:SfiI-subtelomeric related protein family member, putative n=1 Tax=Theileria annulata TaxID=5874 RepID=A0A3B0NBA4_THEAN